MKKLFLLIVLVLTSCTPVAQGFVELPDEQKIAISGIFVAVFALLFDAAIGRLSWLEFFRQYQEAWALAASTLFTAWLQNALPTGFEDLSIKFVALLIAIALYLLGRTWLARRGVKGFLRE
jgi:hypothetical protein